MRAYPNPATDKVTIESEDAFPIKSVCIADIQGTIVVILPVDDTRCTLNVSNLSVGTYIAHVETEAASADGALHRLLMRGETVMGGNLFTYPRSI